MPASTNVSTLPATPFMAESNSLNRSIISPALTLLGWQDPQPIITQANQTERVLEETLQAAYSNYLAFPDQAATDHLNASLTAVIEELKKKCSTAARLAKEANDRLRYEKATTDNDNSITAFIGSVVARVKTIFNSDDRVLFEHYNQLAEKYNAQLKEFSDLRESLQKFSAETTKYSSNQRHLLQVSTNASVPVTYINQYCAPMGSCDLSLLSNGFSGFVLEGELLSDSSGFSSAFGDINGDGIMDMVIGAPNASPYGKSAAGKTYIVFGSTNSSDWNFGSLGLGSFIDGKRGFVLQGETTNDNSGYAVSTGDINNDGIDDLILGAYQAVVSGELAAGKVYVIFGSKNHTAWGFGTLDLNNFTDGQRGFVLLGAAAGDLSGRSLSTGDLNNDGVLDIAIGAYAADPSGKTDAGKTYVVFGSNETAWGSGILNLSTLTNGQRGFALEGENVGDYSGYVVKITPDVNGDDIADLIVGAYQADPSGNIAAGKSYLVFGSNNSNHWDPGTLNIISLMDGTRGVVFEGEKPGDVSGVEVSAVDINGDGLFDVAIGASDANSTSGKISAGKTYVVFGSNETWGSGRLSLSNLTDGLRGFVLEGVVSNSYSGRSLSGAADMNGDGIFDLAVGAYGVNLPGKIGAGKTYIVFGSVNSTVWAPGIIDLDSVTDGHRGFALQGNAGDFSGYPTNMAAGNINGDNVPAIFVGAYQTGRSYLTFGPSLGVAYFAANYLRIAIGETVQLSSDLLAIAGAHFGIDINASIVTIQNIENCYFTASYAPTKTLTTCSMQDIIDGSVRVTHIGNTLPPSYRITVDLPPVLLINSIYSDVQVYFLGFPPNLINNKLSINQNDTVILQVSNLDASDQDDPASALFFIISTPLHGQFNVYDSTNTLIITNVTQFSLQQILNGRIGFTQDGSRVAPSYSVAVTDGKSTTQSQAATISFNSPPILSITPFPLIFNEGEQKILSPLEISATDAETPSELLFIEVANISNGNFSYVNNPQVSFTQFQQFLLTTGAIQFRPNTSMTPSFALRAFDGFLYSSWQVPRFYLNHPPVLHGNPMEETVTQGNDFSFAAGVTFSDWDNDTLTYSAQLKGIGAAGGSPLPPGVNFIPPQYFSGNLPVTTLNIEIVARDPGGLTATAEFILTSEESWAARHQSVWTTLSSVGGALATICVYLWLRIQIANHRRDFPLANNLRKVLNLQYFDFSRFGGDSYKTQVDNFLQQLELQYPKIHSQLTVAEKKSFAMCLAEILVIHDLVYDSECGTGYFGIFCCLNIGFPSRLKLVKFEEERLEIIEACVSKWRDVEGYKLRPLSDLDANTENDTIYIEMKGSTIHYTVMDEGVKKGGEQGTIKAKDIGLNVHPDYEIRPLSDLAAHDDYNPDTIYIEMKGNVIHYAVMPRNLDEGNVDEGNEKKAIEGTLEAKEIELDILPDTIDKLKPHLSSILEITLLKGHTRSQLNTVDELEPYLPAILKITLKRNHTRSFSDKASRRWHYKPNSLTDKACVFFRCKDSPSSVFIRDRQYMRRDQGQGRDVELGDFNTGVSFGQQTREQQRLDECEARLRALEQQVKRGAVTGTAEETRSLLGVRR